MSHVKLLVTDPDDSSHQIPPAIVAISLHSQKHLTSLLENLYDNTDDALFELADRAQTTSLQTIYFDAMRTIRLQRQTLSAEFTAGIQREFQTSFTSAFPSKTTAETSDNIEYALVGQEELEMSVAVSGIVSKVTSQHSLALMQLTKRFDVLAKKRTITERTNPLGPFVVGTLFANTLSSLDVDFKIRIIMMKLFERYVMEQFGALYENANRALIDSGVTCRLDQDTPKAQQWPLPDSTAKHQTLGHTGRTSENHKPLEAAKHSRRSPDNLNFENIRHLLNHQQPTKTETPTIPDPLSPPALCSASDLLAKLTQLQQTPAPGLADLNEKFLPNDLSRALRETLRVDQKQITQLDNDIINFVSMLFDAILDDPNLAIPMKALIARLQIPLIKLAILDGSFLEKSAHPARALLNELSHVGIGWSAASDLRSDALYRKVETVVSRLREDFSDNVMIFSDLLAELREFVAQETRRSVLVEQRVKEAEAGKAKTQAAKLKAQTLINQRIANAPLPRFACEFISNIWARLMTLRAIRSEQDRQAWRDSVDTFNALIDCLFAYTADAPSQLPWKNKNFNAAIAKGMLEIGCTSEEIENTVWWLDRISNSADTTGAVSDHPNRQKSDLNLTAFKPITLTTLVTEGESENIPDPALSAPLIKEGTWVEFDDCELSNTLRCKLATIGSPGQNYIFVNRRGMKVLEKQKKELLRLFAANQLKPIEESQLLDRAMDSVLQALHTQQPETATH